MVLFTFTASAQPVLKAIRLDGNLKFGRNFNEVNYDHTSASFLWKANPSIFHVATLNAFDLTKLSLPDRLGNFIYFRTSASYQLSFLLNPQNDKVNLHIGPFMGLDFHVRSHTPESSNLFRQNSNYAGLVLGFTPGILKNVGKRMFLDFSAPFNLLTLQYTYQRIHNPAWSVQEQKNRMFSAGSTGIFPVSFRFGIGAWL